MTEQAHDCDRAVTFARGEMLISRHPNGCLLEFLDTAAEAAAYRK
jgi:hypothetical protein